MKMKVAEPFLLVLGLVTVFAEISNFSNKEFNEDENRRYIKEEVEASSSDNPNSANHFTDTLPGDPQLDYPTYKKIPETRFSCKGKVNWHYYADIDTKCQVFHVCETEYSKISFLCPIGSVFNQRHLVCDWWYHVDCSDSESLYTLNNDYNDQMLSEEFQERGDRNGFDLSLASSGGNSDPSSSTQQHKQRLENSTSKEEKKRNRFKN